MPGISERRMRELQVQAERQREINGDALALAVACHPRGQSRKGYVVGYARTGDPDIAMALVQALGFRKPAGHVYRFAAYMTRVQAERLGVERPGEARLTVIGELGLRKFLRTVRPPARKGGR